MRCSSMFTMIIIVQHPHIGHKTWEAFIADSNGSNEVTVTNTTTKKILYVTLGNTDWMQSQRANLNEEQMILYNALNTTYGKQKLLVGYRKYLHRLRFGRNEL